MFKYALMTNVKAFLVFLREGMSYAEWCIYIRMAMLQYPPKTPNNKLVPSCSFDVLCENCFNDYKQS